MTDNPLTYTISGRARFFGSSFIVNEFAVLSDPGIRWTGEPAGESQPHREATDTSGGLRRRHRNTTT